MLLAQPYMQRIPLEFLARKVVFSGEQFIIASSVWYGFVAGFFQEILKYTLTIKSSARDSLYVGAGFGVGEAFALRLGSLIQTTL